MTAVLYSISCITAKHTEADLEIEKVIWKKSHNSLHTFLLHYYPDEPLLRFTQPVQLPHPTLSLAPALNAHQQQNLTSTGLWWV